MWLKRILQGRWFGHPLHPLLTHMPAGLWLLAVILDFVSVGSGESWAVSGAMWCLIIGTGIGLLAAITGFADWLDIRADHPAQNTALWHLALMFTATGLFAIDTVIHVGQRQAMRATDVMLGMSAGAYAITLVGAYLGGLLVYDNGISVGRHRRKTGLPQHTIYEPRSETTETGLAQHVGLPAEYHPIVPEAVLREGVTLRVEVKGRVMVLARAGGEGEKGRVCAVQEFCTHRCGPLSAGSVEGKEIVCPWHGSRFDLETGKVMHGPAKVDLKTYAVRVREGIVHVQVEEAAEGRMHEEMGPARGEGVEARGEGVEARGEGRRNPQEEPLPERLQEREKPVRRSPQEK